MSTKVKTETESPAEVDSVRGLRSEPGGRAQRPAGAARLLEDRSPVGLSDEVRDRLSDELIDGLLAGDAVRDAVREWPQRPLDDVYPLIFLDALVLEIRKGATVQRKACYPALGVTVGESGTCSGSASRTARAPSSGCTNAIEALNRQLRKAVKTKGHFPNEEGRPQLIYLAIVKRGASLDENAQPDDSAARAQDPLRRPATRVNRLHMKSDTLPTYKRGAGHPYRLGERE
jgi:Transposase, Mutator family